jgi:hypothetical protein
MNDMNGTIIPRRRLLQMGAWAGGAAIAGITLAPNQAEAEPLVIKKSSKQQAGYQEAVSGSACSSCQHFRAPDACRVVEGSINQQGRCWMYLSKSHAPV